MTWEKGRQLKSFDNIQYTYNANGIRTSKTIAGNKHTYILDGAKILKEVWDNGDEILQMLYDNEDNICGITYNETPYFFQKNLQGDIIAITDNTGKEVARYSYDAWGACTIIKDVSTCAIATINPFRYRSYYFDKEIGMYYLQSRYYDPIVGRFVSSDEAEYTNTIDIAINHNLYCYCENNCVNSKDELGNISWKKITSILAAIAKGIKKIFDFLKKICNEILKLYTGLNPKDISSIAKDIGRSPHRVRQSVQRIVTKMTKIKSVIGKLAIGVTILSMIASLGK